MVEMIDSIDPERLRRRLDEVRDVCGERTEILIAAKYVPVDQLGELAEAGVELLGENRLQDLEEKRDRWGDRFRWDFIGALQSRKVRQLLPLCERIHSLASDSALRRLGNAVTDWPKDRALPQILLQVNVSGEEAKAGFGPEELPEAIERCPLPVAGLMTMPPLTEDPEQSRPHFARLAELAATHGVEQLSMGTSQDWRIAVEEGATVIRLGSSLLR